MTNTGTSTPELASNANIEIVHETNTDCLPTLHMFDLTLRLTLELGTGFTLPLSTYGT